MPGRHYRKYDKGGKKKKKTIQQHSRYTSGKSRSYAGGGKYRNQHD